MLYFWSALVLFCFTQTISFVFAGIATADDTDAGMFYSGLWVPDGDPNTFGHHDTWTNQSGASVTFNFIGTQIEVFATRRPEGQYLTNVSFSIDGGPPTLWTSTDYVPQITYKNLVYTSESLYSTQHEITVVNFGQIFWLDYMQFTTADAPPTSVNNGGSNGSTTTSQPPPTSTTSSSSNPPPASSPHSTSTASPQSLTSTPASSSSLPSASIGSSSLNSSTPANSASQSSTSSANSTAATGNLNNSRSSQGAGSGNATAAASSSPSSSSSHTPLIVGIVVGVVGAIALLLALLIWFCLRSKKRAVAEREMEYATPYGAQQSALLQLSKEQLVSSSTPPHTPGSSMPLIVGDQPDLHTRSLTAPESEPPRSDTPSDIEALRRLAKLQAETMASVGLSEYEQGSGGDVSSRGAHALPVTPDVHASSTLPYDDNYPRDSTLMSTSDPTTMPPTIQSASRATQDSVVSGPSPRPSRIRHSQDAGIRLAGGPLGDPTAQLWSSSEYDDSEIETLPPSYAQIHPHIG